MAARHIFAACLIYDIKLTELLNNLTVRVFVIDGDIVSDTVAHWSPHDRRSIQRQMIAGIPDVRPVPQFEGNMMHFHFCATYEVD